MIDMAVWDAVAKIADGPLFRLLAERYGDGTAESATSSSTPPAATTIRARTWTHCGGDGRVISSSATGW